MPVCLGRLRYQTIYQMPRRNYYQAVILNLDGLLLDTKRITCDAWKRAGGGLGYPMSGPVVRTIVSLPEKQREAFLKKLYGNHFPYRKVFERMRLLSDAYAEHYGIPVVRGVLGVLELLEHLRVPKALASADEYHRTMRWLTTSHLEGRFDVIVTTEDISQEASPRQMYEIAADRLHVAAERCIVLEEPEGKARWAHAAGMTVIMITNFQKPSPEILPCVYRIEQSLANAADNIVALLTTGTSTMSVVQKPWKSSSLTYT